MQEEHRIRLEVGTRQGLQKHYQSKPSRQTPQNHETLTDLHREQRRKEQEHRKWGDARCLA